jgi:rod shape-determining protein MreD
VRSLPTWIAWLAVVVTVQCSFLPDALLLNVVPDLFLLSVIFAAMRADGGPLMIWACTAGLFQDVLSGGIIGMNVLSKPLTGMAVMLFRTKLDFRNPNTQAAVALLASLADGLLISILTNAYLPDRNALETVSQYVVPAAVLNGILFPLLLASENAWRQWRRRADRRMRRAAD